MKLIPQYDFYRTKYGEELLIDVVRLDEIKKYMDIHPVHTLSYFDITFIEEGTGFFSVNDKHYTVNPGDVMFSMPGEVRTWDKHHIRKGYALIFEEEFLLSFFNDPLFLQHLSFYEPQRISAKISLADMQTRINELIRNIISEIKDYQQRDSHILRALLYEMLMLLNRIYRGQYKAEKERDIYINRHIHEFLKLVKTDCLTYHNTAYYAAKLCITPNYLNELVKKTMGVHAKGYIQNQLLLEAKKLLTYTTYSVDEIAAQLHFESASYFIRFFRNHTDYTPLSYRNFMHNR